MTHKSVKGILNDLLLRFCVHCDEPTEAEKGLKEHNELVDQARKALAELIRGEKKEYPLDHNGICECAQCKDITIWNACCEHIAQLIEEKK